MVRKVVVSVLAVLALAPTALFFTLAPFVLSGCGKEGQVVEPVVTAQPVEPEVGETTQLDESTLPIQRAAPWEWPGSMADFKFPFRGLPGQCAYERLTINCGYGCYAHLGSIFHSVDMVRTVGSTDGLWVLAPAMGRVIEVERTDRTTWGIYVKMDHGNGFVSILAHLRDNPWYIQVGDVLQQGTFLGYAGCTGRCTGTHIHMTIWRNGVSQPITGISGYSDIVVGRSYYSGNAYVPPPRGFVP